MCFSKNIPIGENPIRCVECGTDKGILKIYDATFDATFFLYGKCYLDLYGW